MKLEPKTIVTLFVAVVVGVCGVIGFNLWRDRPIPVQPCVAGPNEMCPPADWMASYNEFQKAQKDFQKDMKSEGMTERQRMLSGWASDLAKGIPTAQGYSFNEQTKKFEKPAPPPPPTPTPAPQAKK